MVGCATRGGDERVPAQVRPEMRTRPVLIPAQQVLLREYAAKQGLKVIREFVDAETAKVTGRKEFGNMVTFLTKNRECRVVLAEKTDRRYRNFKDYVVLEDLDVEIHLPKEGHIISRKSRSHDRLIHGIKVVLSRNYIENLSEEVRKGMRQKAAAGIYPTRPPDRISEQQGRAHHRSGILKPLRLCSACSRCSQSEISRLRNCGSRFDTKPADFYAKGYLHKILKNPFYIGL